MAKSVKAPDFDSGTVGSSPAIPARPDPLAQSVEHLPFKQGVRGSIPRRVTRCRFLKSFGASFFVMWGKCPVQRTAPGDCFYFEVLPVRLGLKFGLYRPQADSSFLKSQHTFTKKLSLFFVVAR